MRSNLSRTLLGSLAALALGGSVAVAVGGPAQARPDTADPAAVHQAATTRAAHDRIVEFWTPQRMRDAVPADVLVAGKDTSSAGGAVAAGSPTVVQGAKAKPATTADFQGGYYTGGGDVVDTTGKVFFTLGGVNYVCSGSAVSSDNKDVVLTAGHCVNEGPGDYATNWAFVPAYDDGARPYGTFTARQLTTTTQWQNSGDFDYDVAFAVMNTVDGAHLTDVVGGQAIGFNQPRGEYMYSFGYPQANPYDGSDIAWCHGTVVQDTFGGSTDQGLDCDMTGGSSGGPWFTDYDEASGVGVLNSVNSFKYRGGKMRSYMFGPYLGDVARTLYTSAASL